MNLTCPEHPDASVTKYEHSGELTPTWVAQCDECSRELADSGDGERVKW